MKSLLLEALAERVLVFDGAMGTQIQNADLTPADFTYEGRYLDGCNELLNLTRPDTIQAIHERYLDAGADLIETNTFGATSIVLAEYGIEEMVYDLSLRAGQIARKAADSRSTAQKPRFVVGALGPGTKLISLGQTTWQELEKTYTDGFRGLLEGGADALLLETLQDLLMVKATIIAAQNAMAETGRKVPLFVQVTMEQTGTMLLGTEIGAALNMIEAFPAVTAFGINCATGPVEMAPHIRFLGQNSTRPLSCQPNAGLPVMEQGRAVYKLTPEELAHHHERFVGEHGVALAGSCCGSTPEHTKALVEAVGGRPHTADCHWRRVRHLFSISSAGFQPVSAQNGLEGRAATMEEPYKLVGCSSLYQFQPYRQDASFLIVGEKTNANGSKAFREMLAVENWEGLTELARELEGEGSHVLDVCTAYVGRDETRDMRTLLSYYNRHITVPIMIDSTEWPVIEVALQTVAGKPIVNSINFEDGGARVDKVLSLCQRYGAAVVALTIDEKGMAKTAAEKVAIAERLLEATRAHGMTDHDVFIDCLTFTLGSGDEEFREAGVETIEAIRELRQRHPNANSILGVSNISFGLKAAARQILNSAFLHYALEAGLTSAIVHFSKITPENQIEPGIWKIASDLVFDKREYAQSA
jgi:5-methyltetrahydrofolate--homocysteine methyltransferase